MSIWMNTNKTRWNLSQRTFIHDLEILWGTSNTYFDVLSFLVRKNAEISSFSWPSITYSEWSVSWVYLKGKDWGLLSTVRSDKYQLNFKWSYWKETEVLPTHHLWRRVTSQEKKDGKRLFSILNYCHMTRFLELATLQPIAFIYNSIFCIKAYLNSISKCVQKLLPIQSTEKHFIALITELFLQHYNQRTVLKIRFRLANCE